jgi:diacylglycerol kinase (ATP)
MKEEIFITNSETNSFSLKARLRSFQYAFAGIHSFFCAQHNAIIHFVFTILVFSAALFFNVTGSELIAITLATGFVWAAELFNTAVEKLADTISKDTRPEIKFIKDVSAAAVLISALTAFITGIIIFFPKLLS